jgi:hypothetical protein
MSTKNVIVTCVMETVDIGVLFLKINNIFIHSTGVDFSFGNLSLLRQMMMETVFFD